MFNKDWSLYNSILTEELVFNVIFKDYENIFEKAEYKKYRSLEEYNLYINKIIYEYFDWDVSPHICCYNSKCKDYVYFPLPELH